MIINRRDFGAGLAATALAGLAARAQAATSMPIAGHGPLRPDPAGLLDLAPGFAYRVIDAAGTKMDDGLPTPDRFDGMGAFRLDRDRTILVRNHELHTRHARDGAFPAGGGTNLAAYDRLDGTPLPGGTTSIVYNHRTGQVERRHLSLAGTIRNCAGGTTPWGSWLSCEEDVSRAGQSGLARDHGWVFEVPARARGLVDPVPLTALGRFNHEAAAVDPATGIVYLTEDRADSLIYRLLPARRGDLRAGGRLQALALASGLADTRNFSGAQLPLQRPQAVRWIDLDGVDSREDDLRLRGAAKGAALFARGEGIVIGAGQIFIMCTSGGQAKLGQIMRYRPSPHEGTPREADAPGQLDLLVESPRADVMNFGDNITVGPGGHLVVCEDQYTEVQDNHLRGITPAGQIYAIGRLRAQTELAGACFSADGRTLFVNVYAPGKTLAITGPWGQVSTAPLS
ncbi:alkaline phosphatase PhoX [Sandarakinorhabdus cyanobacteriorum]|uniref:alkaline phosphatase PhoX n=1 Tax=Sandarakinorhabdus cyanobacteriorum TaxID=1981098 RepID=UPI001A9C2CA1|nr:alkaline phosphatase PhoX [Sandarakinorhabdus cyanobacteriorum]